MTDYLSKRTREMYEYYKANGVEQTCEKYHVTYQRVNAVKKKAMLASQFPQKAGELYGLSIRVWNRLTWAGIKTVSELKEKYESGDLLRIRKFGKRAYEEVGEFLREKGAISEQEEMT